MSQNKFLKCACAGCGGRIEFPADGIGSTVACPHCGYPTELALETPPQIASLPPRSLKWVIAGGVILLVGIVAAVGILIAANRLVKKARTGRIEARNSVRAANSDTARPAANVARVRPVAATNTLNDFSFSTVTLDRTAGSALAYAVGALKNETDRQRFGVTVTIDLFDSSGAKVGSTTDYAPVIEPRAEWKFRALLVPKNVASARVTGVQEKP